MYSRAHLAWRQHPWMRQSTNLHPSVMFPGLGTAIALFGTYLFGETMYLQSSLAPDPNAYQGQRFKSAYEAGQAAAALADSPAARADA